MSNDPDELDHGEFGRDDYDGDDDGGFDCGMGPDGLCQYAGTEECDECPLSD